jgi:hypothetical protein
MVLTDSGRISRVPPYLGYPLAQKPVSPTGLSPCFVGLSMPFDYRQAVPTAAPQPRTNFLVRFSLFPFRSPLLGESLLFSSPSGTEMFHFPEFASPCLLIQQGIMPHYQHGVSPFGHSRIIAWLAAPRDFSQPPTSFFASDCLGIHRVPFVAWSLPPLFVLLRHCGETLRKVVTSLLSVLTLCSCQRSRVVRSLSAKRSLSWCMRWWSRSGSNRRHPACKAGALPAELRPRRISPVFPEHPRFQERGGPGKI